MSDISKLCDRLGNEAAEPLMGAGLADLSGYWLEIECCGGMTLIPFRLLHARYGDKPRLRDLVPRLRCRKCRQPPARAWVSETHHRLPRGGSAPGWSVKILPQGAG